ncbi:MAG: hypothetical protein QOD75_1719 [Blastocatellia bacterium]|jgi:hypothetical protein|nr:hypothetical protein [Blastocatellia bacterium]
MENQASPPRPAEQIDLIKLCQALNVNAALYIVIGGMAVNRLGFLRATEDIDLLIEKTRGNQERVRAALEILPDKAVREMNSSDLDRFLVVRVADEIVVDLMLSAGGLTYDDAKDGIEFHTIQGIPIPFASAKLLLRTKQTYREKDLMDRRFLENKIKEDSLG